MSFHDRNNFSILDNVIRLSTLEIHEIVADLPFLFIINGKINSTYFGAHKPVCTTTCIKTWSTSLICGRQLPKYATAPEIH